MLRLVTGRRGMTDQLPEYEEYYACPCCLVACNRAAVFAGILTEEHVPPEGVGGRRLLLTCKNCNNGAGSDFDAHAVTRLDADDFARGRVTGRTLPVPSYADGIPLRGTAQRMDGGIQIFGVPKQNNEKDLVAHVAALDAYVESGDPRPNHSFTIHTRYSEARARISWIRVALPSVRWGQGPSRCSAPGGSLGRLMRMSRPRCSRRSALRWRSDDLDAAVPGRQAEPQDGPHRSRCTGLAIPRALRCRCTHRSERARGSTFPAAAGPDLRARQSLPRRLLGIEGVKPCADLAGVGVA
ncbi:MAG: hypothetical protein QOC80_1519 [Frankiaceae bacterium]|nr:hypothetical protein [Frankiaceae bacterium]